MNLLNDNIKLSSLTLRVVDMDKMIDYYTNVMGFDLYKNDGRYAELGVDKHTYLKLEYDEDNELADGLYTGLYHMAFVLPEENDLLSFINHLVSINLPPTGAADHLFSQAIYFNDPENNGIEVYVDRNKSEWVYDTNQQLKLASDPLDIDTLIDKFDERVWKGMPKEARLGHMHYSIHSMPEAKDFTLNTFGMDVMIEVPSALFTSKGGYHHHFGMNIWNRVKSTALPSHMNGLVSTEILVDNLEEIKEKIKGYDKDFDIFEDSVLIKDKQGLLFNLIQQ